MRKIITFLIIGILAISGIGVGAFSINKTNTLSISSEVYDMVIIAPNKFSASIQPLINHKNSHGVKTFLKTTEEIYKEYKGQDKAEEIKLFIKDAIENNSIKYVLLIGGRQGQSFKWYVPCRYSNVDDGFMNKQFLSDLYFADIYKENGDFEDWDSNGNGIFAEWYEDDSKLPDIMDLKPDVAVGRLPCRNEKEVVSIVEKIIYYENNAYGKPWFNKALLIGGDTNPGVGDPFPYEGEADCNYTMQNLTDFNVTTLFVSDGTLTNYNDFISSFNTGQGFVLFHGHGQQKKLFTHTSDGEQLMIFDSKYISQLNNDGMYPIIVVGCCVTTEFDVGIFNFLTIFKNLKKYHHFFTFKYECVREVLGWDLIKKTNGGSIAHIGCSSTAWGDAGDKNHDDIPDSVQNGYTSGLCAEFFRIIGEKEIGILGDVYTNAITRIVENNSAAEDRIQCKCVQEFQLIGDPSLKIGGYQ